MARLPIRYHRAAVDEIDDTTQRYALESAEAANRFRKILRDKIAEARQFPRHWPLHEDGTRQIHTAPFSYILVDREFKEFLEIVALAHTSRLPGYIGAIASIELLTITFHRRTR